MMRQRAVILWGLFLSIILLGVAYIVEAIASNPKTSLLDLTRITFTGDLIVVLAATLLTLHSMWTLGLYRGLSLVAISFIIGLLSEVVGVRYGTVFGGRYMYNPGIYPQVFGVPLLVPLIWAGFIYTAYSAVSCLPLWLGRT